MVCLLTTIPGFLVLCAAVTAAPPLPAASSCLGSLVCPSNAPGALAVLSHANLSGVTAPTGNAWRTNTALSVQGQTGVPSGREYLVSLGLLSDKGATAAASPFRDKVALYAAVDAVAGTGDVWAFNPLVTQEPSSGSYAAQGIELDFNNNNDHRGDRDGGSGLAFPVSYGLSITGAGSKRSTSALLVSGPGHRIWNRGIVMANDAVSQASFQELGSPKRSLDIRGNPDYGIFQESKRSKNYFGGGTGMGVEHPQATLDVGGDGLLLRGAARIRIGGGAARTAQQPPSHQQATHGLASAPAARTAIYSGTTRLERDGTAIVQLPPSFSTAHPALQQVEISYQLTAIGTPMRSLFVSKEVSVMGARAAASFSIGGGVGGAKSKVSWQVTVSSREVSQSFFEEPGEEV
jgi:hypothetical protein